MSVLTRDTEVAARSSGMKHRRHAVSEHCGAVMVASLVLLPALGGCSFGSPDSASLSRQTAADIGSASQSNPAPAAAIPQQSTVSPETAGASGVQARAASSIYAANAAVPSDAPAPNAANASGAQAAPTPAGTASAPPGTLPEPPRQAENPFYAIYNSLKDGGEQCAMPTESCDNIHRIQN